MKLLEDTIKELKEIETLYLDKKEFLKRLLQIRKELK